MRLLHVGLLVLSAGVVGCNGGKGGGSTGSTGGSGGSSASSSASSSSGGSSSGGSCPGYADLNTSGPCTCASGHHCRPNGCYGGDYCQLSTSQCVAEPILCTFPATGSGSSGVVTPAVTWTGAVTIDGGAVSTLYFAVAGDSRPVDEGDLANYPTPIINQIFIDAQEENVEFIVATGDYQYADPTSQDGPAQLALYAQARAGYRGAVFPAMGNHECDGYTADNCSSTGTIVTGGSGASNNFAAYMSTLVAPLGQSLPYYSINVNDLAGQWTSKFVFIAANAWDSTQAAWLQTTLAVPTTYTFVVRHEPASDNTAPGVTPSEAIIAMYPYTLKVVGHTHEFRQSEDREVIVGNGGAPLETPTDSYGYSLISMTDGGDILVQNMDFQSNTAVNTLTIPK